jgi:hypothetical protein
LFARPLPSSPPLILPHSLCRMEGRVDPISGYYVLDVMPAAPTDAPSLIRSASLLHCSRAGS